jgi:hypothetical protein
MCPGQLEGVVIVWVVAHCRRRQSQGLPVSGAGHGDGARPG